MMGMAEADSALSVAAARRALTCQFRDAGLATPDLDARILVGHALALDHAALAAQADCRLTVKDVHAIDALARRRLNREPVARIVGRKEFWGLPLMLNAATLVPRPDTETVVEAALAALGDRRRCTLRIADLGTGTGALLLALLSELPAARGVGTDISTAALDCARANAAALGLACRAAFVACDQGAALGARLPDGGFDLVVANPPYVASSDIAGLEPEVRDFDPRAALDGGPDGLTAYRAILGDARRLLSPQGVLVLELGAGQLDAVAALAAGAGLAPAGACRQDLGGVPRALAVKVWS
jgi:release factor glutamine methyltransferase